MKGNIIAQLAIYFLVAVIVFTGVTSFTAHMMPPDSSNLMGFMFASGVFILLAVMSWLLGFRKKKDKK
jgi:uncharacterized membrane protein (DUF485 family)